MRQAGGSPQYRADRGTQRSVNADELFIAVLQLGATPMTGARRDSLHGDRGVKQIPMTREFESDERARLAPHIARFHPQRSRAVAAA